MEIDPVDNRRLDRRTPCKRVSVLRDIRLGHHRRDKDPFVQQTPDRCHKDEDYIDPSQNNNKLTVNQFKW
jgi:hypothetical protein